MTTIAPKLPPRAYEYTSEKSSVDGDFKPKFVDIPPLGAPISEDITRRPFWKRRKVSPEEIATQPSVFDDPATLETYRPPPQYENYHRFVPLFRWTWKQERVSAAFK